MIHVKLKSCWKAKIGPKQRFILHDPIRLGVMFTFLVLLLIFASARTSPLPLTGNVSADNSSSSAAHINDVEELTGRRAIHSCEQCGISSVSRIIGGGKSAMDEFPWMVQITNDQEFFCGGTLIGKRHVLTAAHCFLRQRNALKVILGANTLNSKANVAERKVVSVKKHPDFNPSKSKGNDIAILKLENPVAFDRKVRPLCLPATDHQYIGRNGTILGWGRTSIDGPLSNSLMKLVLPVVSFDECREKWYGDTLPIGTLCAGYVQGRKDSCIGDSGGPLMAEHNGIAYQIGIVSWGASSSCALTYGVYTRVSAFLDWIALNTNDDKCLQE